jgi:hypothetical protein
MRKINWLFHHAQSAGQIDQALLDATLGPKGKSNARDRTTGDVRQARDLTEKLLAMGYRKPKV